MTLNLYVNGLNVLPIETIVMPVMLHDGQLYYSRIVKEISDAHGVTPFATLMKLLEKKDNITQGDIFIIPVGKTALRVKGKAPSYAKIMFYIDLGQGLSQTMITDIREKAMRNDITNFAIPMFRSQEPFFEDQRDIVKIMLDDLVRFQEILTIAIVIDLSERDAFHAFSRKGYVSTFPLL